MKKNRRYIHYPSLQRSVAQFVISWVSVVSLKTLMSMRPKWSWKSLWFIHTKLASALISTRNMNGQSAITHIVNKTSVDLLIYISSAIKKSVHTCKMMEVGISVQIILTASTHTRSLSNCSVHWTTSCTAVRIASLIKSSNAKSEWTFAAIIIRKKRKC